MTDIEVGVVQEAAVILKLVEATAYSWAQSRGLPAFEICGQWRIHCGGFQRRVAEPVSGAATAGKGGA